MLLQAGSFDFRTFVGYLQDIGAYEIFLPFLLVFAIVFAVLEKTKIFGEKSNINVVVAFIIGLLLVVQQGVVATINNFLPQVSLIIVVALAFLLVVAMLAGREFEGLKNWGLTAATIIAVIALVLALNPSWPDFLSAYDRDQVLYIGIGLLFAIGAIWLVAGVGRNRGQGEGIAGALGAIDKALRKKGE